WIHGDADRQLGERVAFLGARQNRRLVAEPVHVAKEHEHEQASGAQSNGEMGARKAHQEKFGGWARRRQDYFRYLRKREEAGASSLAGARLAAQPRSGFDGRRHPLARAAPTRVWAKF